MDPFTLIAGIGSAVSATASVFREIREWRNGTRDRLELSADRSGHVQQLQHDGAALMKPAVIVPTYATLATVVGQFRPADDVAARRLTTGDQALVLLWPSGGDPEFDSVVFTCELSEMFAVEIPGGTYDLVAYVFDHRRDEILGTAWIQSMRLHWSTDYDLAVDVTASEALYLSDALAGQIGNTAGELIMPDGVRVPLGWSTVIGRSSNANIQLDDAEVSLSHARIQFHDGLYEVQDLGSTNGTLVNGQFIGLCPLQDGDVITVAQWQLEFRLR